MMKEPAKQESTIKKSDLAKIWNEGRRTNRNEPMLSFKRSNGQNLTGKTTEEIVQKHANEACNKFEGEETLSNDE